jgi:hypothetical protein
MTGTTRVDAIRFLNDEFRRNLSLGVAVITPGIAALGPSAVQRIVQTITTFDDFSKEHDPYGERDFGAFDANGLRVFFKIEYYDLKITAHSPDPANPRETTRVMTIMLSNEY